MKEKIKTEIKTKDKTKTPLWYTAEAIVGTLLEEAALVLIVLWVLPIFGIHVSWWWLAALMVALAIVAYVTYRVGKGTFFVKRKAALEALVGSEGRGKAGLDREAEEAVPPTGASSARCS